VSKDTYGILASWPKRRHDCCLWRVVTCNNETGHAIELDFDYMDLVGQISPSLLSLQHLEYLDLIWTSLHGPNGHVFPEFLCSLHNLRHLDLSNTLFSGRAPAQLANLSKLEYLDISIILLSDTLPPQLGNLSNLRHLGLSFMQELFRKKKVSCKNSSHVEV
jgi:Leucine-rich repeat (LRR) protein